MYDQAARFAQAVVVSRERLGEFDLNDFPAPVVGLDVVVVAAAAAEAAGVEVVEPFEVAARHVVVLLAVEVEVGVRFRWQQAVPDWMARVVETFEVACAASPCLSRGTALLCGNQWAEGRSSNPTRLGDHTEPIEQ